MSRIAFIFPGQGSQAIGMGKELADAFPAARAVFDEVDDALGEKLSGADVVGDDRGADADGQRAAGPDGGEPCGGAGAGRPGSASRFRGRLLSRGTRWASTRRWRLRVRCR